VWLCLGAGKKSSRWKRPDLESAPLLPLLCLGTKNGDAVSANELGHGRILSSTNKFAQPLLFRPYNVIKDALKAESNHSWFSFSLRGCRRRFWISGAWKGWAMKWSNQGGHVMPICAKPTITGSITVSITFDDRGSE